MVPQVTPVKGNSTCKQNNINDKYVLIITKSFKTLQHHENTVLAFMKMSILLWLNCSFFFLEIRYFVFYAICFIFRTLIHNGLLFWLWLLKQHTSTVVLSGQWRDLITEDSLPFQLDMLSRWRTARSDEHPRDCYLIRSAYITGDVCFLLNCW